MRAASQAQVAHVSPVADWFSMVRPRVATMVFLATVVGAMLAGTIGFGTLVSGLEAALYVTLVTGCASILNQVLERDTDRLMHRTQDRPLVTGRLAVRDALIVALALGAVGTIGLAVSFNLLSALLAVATLAMYVGVYTPMKRVSTLNTVIGALPGAAPPLLGYVALAGTTGPWAWVLFAVLFAWQFPHFMAIAWLYRDDYARAGMRMLPSVVRTAGSAGRQATLYGSALLPISLMPLFRGMAGPFYATSAVVLGCVYVYASVAFALREDRQRARVLLYVSLLYLPLLFASILIDPSVRTLLARS